MFSLLPLLTLLLSALMVSAAPAANQVSCKPMAKGRITLYRYRQVPQGLEISKDDKSSEGLRLLTSSDAGKPGVPITFLRCTSSFMGHSTSSNVNGTQFVYGQLRTPAGRCITAINNKNKRGQDQTQFVAKTCPTADGEAQRAVTFELSKSERNGLSYTNSNYKLVLTSVRKGEKRDSITYDFNGQAIVYGQSPRGLFESTLRLRNAQDL